MTYFRFRLDVIGLTFLLNLHFDKDNPKRLLVLDIQHKRDIFQKSFEQKLFRFRIRKYVSNYESQSGCLRN